MSGKICPLTRTGSVPYRRKSSVKSIAWSSYISMKENHCEVRSEKTVLAICFSIENKTYSEEIPPQMTKTMLANKYCLDQKLEPTCDCDIVVSQETALATRQAHDTDVSVYVTWLLLTISTSFFRSFISAAFLSVFAFFFDTFGALDFSFAVASTAWSPSEGSMRTCPSLTLEVYSEK